MVTRNLTHRMEIAMREILCSGKISSTNERVNVMPSFGELNNYFHRASNRTKGTTIESYLKECAKSTFLTTSRRAGSFHDLTLFEIYGERGMYGFTVWGDEK